MTDRPAIKPLGWKFLATPPSGEEYASTSLGTYFIELGYKRFPVKIHSHQIGTYDTLEAAKAAAQQDYERRIRSCLIDKPEAVEGEPDAWRVKMSAHSDDYWHYFTKEPRYREEGEIWQPLFLRPTDTDAAQSEVEVKALEWRSGWVEEAEYANTLFGDYYAVRGSPEGMWGWRKPGCCAFTWIEGTKDEAKVAAQSDYEAHIRSTFNLSHTEYLARPRREARGC